MPSVRQPPKQRSRTGWAIRVLRWFTTTGICGLTIVSGGCSQSTSFRATRCCAAINLNRRCLEKAKRDEGREPAGEMKKLTICLSFCPSDGYKANRLPQLPAKQGVAEGVSCSSGEGGTLRRSICNQHCRKRLRRNTFTAEQVVVGQAWSKLVTDSHR